MARPVFKFALPDRRQLKQLEQMKSHHRLPSHRRRAEAILLSVRDYSAAQIADIVQGHPDTVRRWIDRFNQHGIDGITDKPRKGGDPALNDHEQSILRELIECYPNRARTVLSKLKEETGKQISRSTLRRYCHRFGLNWKRFRKSLRKKRDQAKFDKAKRKIANLAARPDRDVYYFDESALTLREVVPYGWQPVGERIEVPVTGGSRPSLQALGFQSCEGDVHCYLHRSNVSTWTVTSVIDHFISTLTRPATIVIDNASVHTSEEFRRQELVWQQRNVEFFRIPPYSPELNRIERFWEKLKYELMPVQAWETFDDMLECATACIANIGTVFHMPSLVTQ
ncbi:IS630 family transposase [Stieleria varia]|uniref:Integrase core domain protein n=1 Tax=Stieleria varia TaxID=2528005 RepID=A0A5C6ANC9_9BACT|nr:IS630 family transposase [Stieleria varia]TWU01007.1 Integrase core domain protein [Stieleria varia]